MPQDTTKQQNSTNKNDGNTLPPLPELKHINPNPIDTAKPLNTNPLSNPGMNPFSMGNSPTPQVNPIPTPVEDPITPEPIEDKFPKIEEIKVVEKTKEEVNKTNPFPTKVEVEKNKTVEKSNIKEKSLGNIEEIISSGAAKKQSLLDILYSQGKITKEQFESFKFEILSKNLNEETFVFDKGIVSHMDLLKAKSETYKIPFIDLSNMEIKKDILYKIPYESAKNNLVVAFEQSAEGVKIALVDPLDIQKVRFVEAYVNDNVIPYFADEEQIKKIIDTKYSTQFDTEVSQAVESVSSSGLTIKEEVESFDDLNFKVQNAPVSRIVNMILEYGVKFKASDVHIEPKEGRLSVRYRIHGILNEKLTLPLTLTASVVSRIKILSELKIDEHRIPQDGRFEISVGKSKVDLRVSTMPVVHGEKVVIRILDKTTGIVPLEQTGLRGPAYKTYTDILKATQGIILITGPTGSGKTVTLASSLATLNNPGVNIVTLEDPVEIRIDGANQVQVNADVGLTFATGLRAFLRQDPDIIMVGEIRDQETAQLAVQAALVGRLVLATLHTNSSAAAIPRLLDMGVEPYLLSSVINVIVAQRLPRKLCKDCREKIKADDVMLKKIHQVMDGLQGFDMYSYPKRDFKQLKPGETPSNTNIETADKNGVNEAPQGDVFIWKAKGCDRCAGTGYTGRIGIFEVLKMNEKISKMIIEHRSSQSIQEQAQADGMILMIQDGFMKALDGETTIEEVLRVQN